MTNFCTFQNSYALLNLSPLVGYVTLLLATIIMCAEYRKGWLAIATLKPTFTFLGRDFAIFNTFTWQNPYQEKWKLVLELRWLASPFCKLTLTAAIGIRPGGGYVEKWYFQSKLELVWIFSDFDQKVGHWKISKDVKLKKKFKLKNNISKPN